MSVEQILTLVAFQDALYDITKTITGFGNDYIHHAFQPDSQPAVDQEKNYVFINLSPVDNPYDKQRNIEFKAYDPDYGESQVNYTQVIEATWSFYGPESYDNADYFRYAILLESNRSELSKDYIFPIPSIKPAPRIPYQINNQWIERSDISVTFNAAVRRNELIAYFKSANIKIVNHDGVQRDITVEP